MSLAEYFEQHEEQAFIVKALVTAVAIILIKNFLSGFITFLLIISPLVFLVIIRMHAAASGIDAMELLREHITFFPMMRSENERCTEIKPWVTYGIILVNVLVFYGFEMNVPLELISNHLIFLPREPDFFNVPLSAFTAMFLHGSNGHLWGNMTFLWVVGSAVERRVGMKTFSWLYLLTGIIGGLVYIMVEFVCHGRAGHALGASGAIAGIMGVFAVRCYFKSMIFPVPILGIFSLILPISLKIRLNSLVIMSLFFLSDLSGGIGQITGENNSMIGHWAHLGGMVAGMLLAGYLRFGEEAIEERHLEIGVKASEATVGYGDGKRSMEKVLERNPENLEALLGMARLETKVRATPRGKELYEKVLGLMMAARPQEGVEVFVEYYQKYLSVPDEPVVVSSLVEALRQAGETELCIQCLERLVEMAAVAPAVREKGLFQLANLLEYTSRFDAARSCYARFAAEYPASLLAGRAREKAGNEVYAAPRQAMPVAAPAPAQFCPDCGAVMTTRPAKEGPNRGKLFWVCSAYPSCSTYLPFTEPAEAAVERPTEVSPLPAMYRLMFDGTIELTADPDETRANLARLFRCGPEKIARLFSGKPVQIKGNLDRETAHKMKEAFDRTGAICTLEAEAAEPAPPLPASSAPRAAAPPSAAAAAEPVPAVADQDFACPKCGQQQPKGEACVACGVYFAKLAKRLEQEFSAVDDTLMGGGSQQSLSEEQERLWAMCCHLLVLSGIIIPLGNILLPLAIWLWKRKESGFVDYHGKTALNFQLTLLIFIVGVSMVAVFTGAIGLLTGSLYSLLGLYTLAIVVAGAVKSRRGDYLEISLSAEFIK